MGVFVRTLFNHKDFIPMVLMITRDIMRFVYVHDSDKFATAKFSLIAPPDPFYMQCQKCLYLCALGYER